MGRRHLLASRRRAAPSNAVTTPATSAPAKVATNDRHRWLLRARCD
jgi:hypothetical protein